MGIQRRRLLKAAGPAVTGGVLAGCQGNDSDDDRPLLDAEPDYRGWFDGVGNYRGTVDSRNEETVSVQVGVSGDLGHFKFGPPAIAVSPGTTVAWEWTGRGGAHNVVSEHERFDSGDPVDRNGETYTFEFEDPAIYRYLCEPHRELGMRGAVFVSLGD